MPWTGRVYIQCMSKPLEAWITNLPKISQVAKLYATWRNPTLLSRVVTQLYMFCPTWMSMLLLQTV